MLPMSFFFSNKNKNNTVLSVLASTYPFKYGAYSSLETM